MAPAERLALMALTRQIARERRMGVLFTEHSMDVVFGQADRVLVLVRGPPRWPKARPSRSRPMRACKRPIWAQALMWEATA